MILLDINHIAHINFFKNALDRLGDYAIDYEIIAARPRNNLVSVLEKEYKRSPLMLYSTFKKSIFNKALVVLHEDIKIKSLLKNYNYDLLTGTQSISLAHVAYLTKKPSVVFTDDLEYKLEYYAYKPFASRIVVPAYFNQNNRKFITYHGFKELAYLHPKYFTANQKILHEYSLIPGNYVFIREVSSMSSNYNDLVEGKLASICPQLRKMGLKIVLSLENKELRKYFEDTCIILNEPVNDIYSLLNYAAFSICSGDTMARESSLLGTPSIYTGGRKMAANKELMNKGILFKSDDIQDTIDTAKNIINKNIKERTKEIIFEAINSEWEDTTEVIINSWLSVLDNDDTYIQKYINSR